MTLTGTIYDATTGQPLPGATVAVVKNGSYTGEGTISDDNGDYALTVADPVNSQLQVSYIGYETVIRYQGDTSKIFLFPNGNTLPGVTITASKPTNKKLLISLGLGALLLIVLANKK